jgi:hypothetical protein
MCKNPGFINLFGLEVGEVSYGAVFTHFDIFGGTSDDAKNQAQKSPGCAQAFLKSPISG